MDRDVRSTPRLEGLIATLRSLIRAAASGLVLVVIMSGTPASAATLSTISGEQARGGLAQSTSHLYWTTFTGCNGGWVWCTATLYRAPKSGPSGQASVIYEEQQPGQVIFQGFAYASVDGAWYGYVVVNYAGSPVSQLKRIPLGGGTAVTLATIGAPTSNLETDGSFLYRADRDGLRKVPIGGGAITTLTTKSSVSHVGLDATRVYFATPYQIASVAKTGGASTTHVVASSPVSALYIYRGSVNPVIYWGEQNGSLSSYITALGTTIRHQPSAVDRRTTSVSFDGSRICLDRLPVRLLLRAPARGRPHVCAADRGHSCPKRHGRRRRDLLDRYQRSSKVRVLAPRPGPRGRGRG